MTSRPPKPAPRHRARASNPVAEIDARSYSAFVGDLKQKIIAARHRAGLSVNRELVLLYWTIGRDILGRQEREGWGSKVIDRLAEDLCRAFPEIDLPQRSGPVSVLVHDGCWSYDRGGRRSGSGWRSRPLHGLGSWRPIAQR